MVKSGVDHEVVALAIDHKVRLEASGCQVEWCTTRLRPRHELRLQEDAPKVAIHSVTAWPEHRAAAAMRRTLQPPAASTVPPD